MDCLPLNHRWAFERVSAVKALEVMAYSENSENNVTKAKLVAYGVPLSLSFLIDHEHTPKPHALA